MPAGKRESSAVMEMESRRKSLAKMRKTEDGRKEVKRMVGVDGFFIDQQVRRPGKRRSTSSKVCRRFLVCFTSPLLDPGDTMDAAGGWDQPRQTWSCWPGSCWARIREQSVNQVVGQ
jgi:hypothetical protein